MQARRYNPSLATYVNFTLMEPARRIVGLTQSLPYSNQYFNAKIIATLSNDRMTLRTYSGYSFKLIETYNFNESIINFIFFTYNVTGKVNTFFFILCKSSSKIAFNSVVTTMPASFYNNIVTLDAIFLNSYYKYTSELQVNFTIQCLLSQSNKALNIANYKVIFSLNTMTNVYSFANPTIVSMNQIVSMPAQVNSIMVYSSSILAQ